MIFAVSAFMKMLWCNFFFLDSKLGGFTFQVHFYMLVGIPIAELAPAIFLYSFPRTARQIQM